MMLASQNGNLSVVEVRTHSESALINANEKVNPLLPVENKSIIIPSTAVLFILIPAAYVIVFCRPKVESSTQQGHTTFIIASKKNHVSVVEIRARLECIQSRIVLRKTD